MRTVYSAWIAAALLALSGCASMGGSGESDPVNVDNPKALQETSDVAIGSFKITFVTFDKSSAKAESSMFSSDSGYAKSVMRAKLNGVSDEVFQTITDKAYEEFVEGLENKGFNVVDRSKITGHKKWSKMNTVDSPHKDTFNKALKSVTGGSREDATFAATGLEMFKVPFNDVKAPITPYEYSEVAKDTGIPILDVHYTVHFVRFSSNTNYNPNDWNQFKGAEYSAEVLAGQGVHVVSGPSSRVTVIKGMGGTFSNPNANITAYWTFLEPGPYGKTSDATSGAQKAANAFSSLMGAFSGGASSAKEIDVTADPALYQERAMGAVNRANEAFLNAMKPSA
jgi:hypothetical protein